ncbi:unnamed protein product [Cyprideis torosa]|uniref:protein-tyrosine-phosphatase n=1 Tax=Cyprideis torosa TaxID=163714 RepID=A0A7R8W5T4_9CRUS|nr:unnamed protein product [Cyprideis torosa]CAG0880182.1 unnamed protein product [Cyprideis torosa]
MRSSGAVLSSMAPQMVSCGTGALSTCVFRPPLKVICKPRQRKKHQGALSKGKAGMTKSQPSVSPSRTTNSSTVREVNGEHLAWMMSNSREKIMVLDCRSFLEFNNGHIDNAVNVWCSKLLNRRLQQNKVSAREILSSTFHVELEPDIVTIVYDQNSGSEDALDREGFLHTLMEKLKPYSPVLLLKAWYLIFADIRGSIWKVSAREILSSTFHVELEPDIVTIVYDQNSGSEDALDREGFLHTLMEKLKPYSPVLLLKGGYESFHKCHPELCSDPAKWRPILKTLSQPCLNINQGATKILPFLYLGGEQDAGSEDFLQAHNISYVLNLSLCIPKPSCIPDANFLRIPVHDSCNEKLTPHFSRIFDFLDKAQESGGCVLVHCHAGISRSPTVTIAYVMKRLHLTSEEGFRYVKSKRPIIAPNFNFLGQLLEFEHELRDQLSHCLQEIQTAPPTCTGLSPLWEAVTATTATSTCLPLITPRLSPRCDAPLGIQSPLRSTHMTDFVLGPPPSPQRNTSAPMLQAAP